MDSKRLREMNEDELSVFITMDKLKCGEELFKGMSKEAWVLKVIEKRFEAYGLRIDKKVMIMILTMGNGTVGYCARYVDDIAAKMDDIGKEVLSWSEFVKEIYPHGVLDLGICLEQ